MKRLIVGCLSFLISFSANAFQFVPGWNLSGNGKDQLIDVATTFGAQAVKSGIVTIWKWDSSNQVWAFFSPSLADGGAAYASSKGYGFLKTILPGEGFWVNANKAVTVPDPVGAAIAIQPWQLMAGWNLIATGTQATPAQVSNMVAPFSATTIWAWNPSTSSWYFYAPSLDQAGTLANYIASKSYLDFGATRLSHGVGFWVNRGTATGSPTANLAPLDQAKQMMAELRNTGESWANVTGTGALDAQIKTMSNLASTIAVPSTINLQYRLAAIIGGEELFRKIVAGETSGYSVSPGTTAGTNVFSTYDNAFDNTGHYSSSPVPGFAYFRCATNAIILGQAPTSVSCNVLDTDGIRLFYNWSGGTTTSYFIFGKAQTGYTYAYNYTTIILSPAAGGGYTYTAQNRQYSSIYTYSTNSSVITPITTGTTFTGTTQVTVDGNGVSKSIALSGELPAPTSATGSTKLSVNMAAIRARVTASPCSLNSGQTYCPYVYDFNGSMAGYDSNGSSTFSISLDSGSQIAVMETSQGESLANGSPTSANLIGTISAPGFTLTGNVNAQNFKLDADGISWLPTQVSLAGNITDTSIGGVGTLFNGQIQITNTNWATFHSKQPVTSTNFEQIHSAANATLQLPSRPVMGLTISLSAAGPTTTTTSGQFVYGNGIVINIAGTKNTSNPSASSVSYTNQDNVVLTVPNLGNGTLSKGGTRYGVIANGIIYYSDGFFESAH